jgi:hypothetical protein
MLKILKSAFLFIAILIPTIGFAEFRQTSPSPSPTPSPTVSPSARATPSPSLTADGCYTSRRENYRECLKHLRIASYGASESCTANEPEVDYCWDKNISSCIEADFYCDCSRVRLHQSLVSRAVSLCGSTFD